VLGNQADVELDMINAISAADIASIMSIIDTGWEIKNKKNKRDENENYYLLWCVDKKPDFFHGKILQSNQVKRTPQDYI